MDLIFRIILFLLGCWVVIATYSSIITTIILPRSVSSLITFISWLAVLRTFLFLVDRRSTFEAKDRVMAFLGPVSILTTLSGWVALFLLGYGLMFWSVENTSMGSGVWLSGSSLLPLVLHLLRTLAPSWWSSWPPQPVWSLSRSRLGTFPPSMAHTIGAKPWSPR